MGTKFVIFVLISTFLAAAICSTPISYVLAREWHCVQSPDKKTSFCYAEPKNSEDPIDVILCTQGATPACKDYTQAMSSNKLPPDWINGLDAVIERSQKTTEAPNTDLVPDGNQPPLPNEGNESKIPNDQGKSDIVTAEPKVMVEADPKNPETATEETQSENSTTNKVVNASQILKPGDFVPQYGVQIPGLSKAIFVSCIKDKKGLFHLDEGSFYTACNVPGVTMDDRVLATSNTFCLSVINTFQPYGPGKIEVRLQNTCPSDGNIPDQINIALFVFHLQE